MLVTKSRKVKTKMTDFGLSKVTNSTSPLESLVGTTRGWQHSRLKSRGTLSTYLVVVVVGTPIYMAKKTVVATA